MDIIMLDGAQPVDVDGEEGEQTNLKLSTLKQKWEALQLDAEQRSVAFPDSYLPLFSEILDTMQILAKDIFVARRRAALELILPRAQLFQEGVDSLQQWFMSVEQTLAELRNAERVMLHLPEATDRAKVRELPCTSGRNLHTWKYAFYVKISHVWNIFT